jgi:hypothetical protein
VKTLQQILEELTARKATPFDVVTTIIQEGGLVFSPENARKMRQVLRMEE